MNSTIKKADLDWKNLPFDYVQTDFNIRYRYKDGKWSDGELSDDENVSIHVASGSLHYGQEAFEGLKAFETRDGRVAVFRPYENAARMNRSNERIYMPLVPEELFVDAVKKVVKTNARFVPPYGTGASLYIRPLMIGVGPRVGLGPSPEYMFIVFVNPVGPYYKGGFKPVHALVVEEFDRAAPMGVGDCKVGGNYAAGLRGGQFAKDKGYPIPLYLDPKEKRYIDEFGTSNFIAIKGDTYLTPSSSSILPSITNASHEIMAEEMGMKVVKRPIEIAEIENFDEVGAVGTAAVVTPVSLIHYRGRDYRFGEDGKAGKVITALYDRLVGVQNGEIEDKNRWLEYVDL
jgi:branched-chain amino acid aminotransferase